MNLVVNQKVKKLHPDDSSASRDAQELKGVLPKTRGLASESCGVIAEALVIAYHRPFVSPAAGRVAPLQGAHPLR